MEYTIEKDKILKCFIVWEAHKNYKIDRFRGTKKECATWLIGK